MNFVRLPLGLIALVAAIVIFSACGGSDRTAWRPTEAPSGTELHIGVYVGGCDSFDTISVRETEEDVTLQAYIDHDTKTSCPDILNFERKTVQLREPLGDRPLLGCNPSDSRYKLPEGVSNDDCASTLHP